MNDDRKRTYVYRVGQLSWGTIAAVACVTYLGGLGSRELRNQVVEFVVVMWCITSMIVDGIDALRALITKDYKK